MVWSRLEQSSERLMVVAMTARARMGTFVGILMLVALLMPERGTAQVERASDEVKLQVSRQEIDEDAAGRPAQQRIDELAKKFNVEPAIVENLRNVKQGWGEITIRLALAQELTKVDPQKFPSMTEALQQVGELRAQKMGWGKIANELGFKLGPVVSEVQRTRDDFKSQAKSRVLQERTHLGKDKTERSETSQRIERPERAQRPERPERPQRPDRPDRPERPNR